MYPLIVKTTPITFSYTCYLSWTDLIHSLPLQIHLLIKIHLLLQYGPAFRVRVIIQVPLFCFGSNLLLMCLEVQSKMPQVSGSLVQIWDTRMEFLAPGFSLANSTCGCPSDEWTSASPSLDSALSNKQIKTKNKRLKW